MKDPVGSGGIRWRCVEAAAELLGPRDREIVLGDLAETDRSIWSELGDVLSLAALRQITLWKNWRPWAATFGLALPASLFLMGCSLAATGAAFTFFDDPSNMQLLWRSISRLFLLTCWAWMAGFTVGAVSRGTLWASLLGCCAPCLYCLSKWPGHGLSELQLLIFLIPGLWGAWRGLNDLRLGRGWACFLASIAMFTPLMWSRGGWMYGCWLLWPGWYLAAAARREPT